MAFALAGKLELVVFHLFAGALSFRVSDVANAPQVLLVNLVNAPANAAGMVARVERAWRGKRIHSIKQIAGGCRQDNKFVGDFK